MKTIATIDLVTSTFIQEGTHPHPGPLPGGEGERSRCLGVIAALLVFATCNLEPTTCNAQSTNSSTQQFWDTALGYFSSFNTNLTTFTATNWHGNIWAGADYQSGVNVASSLGLEYGTYKLLSLENVTPNAAVAGYIHARVKLTNAVTQTYTGITHLDSGEPFPATGWPSKSIPASAP